MKTIPKLSVTLRGTRNPWTCQSCCAFDLPPEIRSVWQEHDDQDRPTAVHVVLCVACAKRLIEPHPRLYRQLEKNEPSPGILDLCLNCTFRDGVQCRHPKLKANGGDGLNILIPRPDRIHVCRRGRGQKSGWIEIWRKPATSCEGQNVETPQEGF